VQDGIQLELTKKAMFECTATTERDSSSVLTRSRQRFLELEAAIEGVGP
jgi:hypothetical protein